MAASNERVAWASIGHTFKIIWTHTRIKTLVTIGGVTRLASVDARTIIWTAILPNRGHRVAEIALGQAAVSHATERLVTTTEMARYPGSLRVAFTAAPGPCVAEGPCFKLVEAVAVLGTPGALMDRLITEHV